MAIGDTSKRLAQTGIVVADATDSTIATIEIPMDATTLFLQVTNSGGVAFDTFILSRRCHASGDYEIIANAAGNFTSPQKPILEASISPVDLAASGKFYMRMEVEATETILVQASGNAAATTADVYYFVD